MRILPTGFIAPCLPTKAPRPPTTGEWLHEIKHDGFRVIARKAGTRRPVRPSTDAATAAATATVADTVACAAAILARRLAAVL